jgi:flagellar assembly protein FliH
VTLRVNRKISGIKAERVSDLHFRPRSSHNRLKTVQNEMQQRSESAYRYGFEDGKKIGLEEGKTLVEQALELFRRVTDEVRNERNRILLESEQIVVRLAVAVAKTIIHEELRTDNTLIRNIVLKAVKSIEDKTRLHIKVNPGDWRTIKEFEEQILTAAHGVKELEIREDEHVKPGGCIIEGNSGIIDAQLDTQLTEIVESLIDAV